MKFQIGIFANSSGIMQGVQVGLLNLAYQHMSGVR